MDLQLVRNSLLDYTRRNRKWVVLVAALGFSSYGAYKVYNSPSVVRKRARVSKLLGALMSIADVIADFAETIGVVSREFKDFLESDSDQIPNSLKQISKVVRSNEVSDSVISITRALTVGILCSRESRGGGRGGDTGFLQKVFDKLSSPAGSGFVSAVVGSFARNMVLAIYQGAGSSGGGLRSNSDVGIASANDRVGSEMDYVERFVGVACGDKCKELIGDCIKLFVSTAVAVYLDKTMHINPYNDLFAGMTDPKHEKQVKDVMISICSGAIETLVKTSHEVLTKPDSKSYSNFDSPRLAIGEEDEPNYKLQNDFGNEEAFSVGGKTRKSFDEGKNDRWINKVSSTLAVPSNRRLVLDVTGRVTFEIVRSFLEVLIEKLYEGLRRCIMVVQQSVVDTSNDVFSYISAKTSLLTTLCLTVCLHILDGAWILMPA